MGNLDFYAVKDDLIPLLAYIFNETDFRVYESYSEFDCEIREFRTVEEITSTLPLGIGTKVILQLWSPSVSLEIRVKRIEFKRKQLMPFTHRYCIEGWGLIQLWLGGLYGASQKQIQKSNLSHNGQKRAMLWEATHADQLGPVSSWNWPLLEQYSRKLRYHINKHLSAGKHGSAAILQHANDLLKRGYTLV